MRRFGGLLHSLLPGKRAATGWTFYGPANSRGGLSQRAALILGLLRPQPRLRRVGLEVPERLQAAKWPDGVTAMGTYRRRGRDVPTDERHFLYRWPGADASGSGALEAAGRHLTAAGFGPDYLASWGGFVLPPTAFFWNEARTQRIIVICVQPGVLDFIVHAWEEHSTPGRPPLLFPPDGTELTQVGGMPQHVTLRSLQSAQTLLDGWCTQITAQGWQEDGRLLADWGAHAQFRSPATGQIGDRADVEAQPEPNCTGSVAGRAEHIRPAAPRRSRRAAMTPP